MQAQAKSMRATWLSYCGEGEGIVILEVNKNLSSDVEEIIMIINWTWPSILK